MKGLPGRRNFRAQHGYNTSADGRPEVAYRLSASHRKVCLGGIPPVLVIAGNSR